MTSEKLAEFRAKGMLLDPKFDRLAKIRDKREEKEEKELKLFNEIEVEKIEVFGKQVKGSNNDNTGKIEQFGLVFGNNYTFRVTKFHNKTPSTIIPINWEIKYNSIKKNKNIKLTAISITHDISLNNGNFKDQEGNRIDLEDICGRMIFVKAFIKNREYSNNLKIWHHNRFYNIDRLILEEQILVRQMSPWKIDQARTSLCGPASIFYIFAKYNFLEFYKFTKELFRTGRAKYNNFEVVPHKDAFQMFAMNPDSKEWPKRYDRDDKKTKKMYEVDWLNLSLLRSAANDTLGTYKGDGDDTTAVSWPKMMVRLCKEFLGYKEVEGININIPLKKFTKDHLKIGKLINQINNDFGSGYKIICLIDSDLISNDEDYVLPQKSFNGEDLKNSLNSFSPEYHWVVLESPLQSIVTFDNDNQIVKKIDFIVYTWGVNLYDKQQRYLKESISYEHFMKNFYGYIKMK